jgi:pimeloyl-ACP methyl ester carboxylesterase
MKILNTEKVSGPTYKDTVNVSYESSFDGRRDWTLLEPGKSRTWVVGIHGHGSHGDQIYTRQDVAEAFLPFYREKGFGLLSPNLRDNAWMNKAAVHDFHEMLALVRAEYKAERFLLVSGSMGGTSNLIYAVNHPEDVAGLVALCPATDIPRYYNFCVKNEEKIPVLDEIAATIKNSYGGSPDELPALYAAHSAFANASKLTMPVYLCHASGDPLIPVTESRSLAQCGKVKTLRFDEIEGGHDSPIPHFKPGVEWLIGLLF